MKIKVNEKEYKVNSINYADKLELRGYFWDVYKHGEKNIVHRDKNKLLAYCAKLAFDNPDKTLKGLGETLEQVLMQVLLEYMGLSDTAKKTDGA